MAEVFRVDLSKIFDGIENIQNKSRVAIRMYAQEGANKIEKYGKEHRRWKDRTGHARQRLVGYLEEEPDKTRICFSHGVNYGVYLELCHHKRFAILQEAVNNNAEEILEGYSGMIEKMK